MFTEMMMSAGGGGSYNLSRVYTKNIQSISTMVTISNATVGSHYAIMYIANASTQNKYTTFEGATELGYIGGAQYSSSSAYMQFHLVEATSTSFSFVGTVNVNAFAITVVKLD